MVAEAHKALELSSRSASPHVLDPEVAALRDAIVAKLLYSVGKDLATARPRDWFMATALATRDRMVDRWMDSTRLTNLKGLKRVYYLSLEFLLGRLHRIVNGGGFEYILIDTAAKLPGTEEDDAAIPGRAGKLR